MQQFYLALDYGKGRFAINGVYTPIEEIKKYGFRDPDHNPSSNKSIILVVIVSIVIVLAVVGIIGYVMVRVKNRRLEANLAKYEQL